MPTTANSITYFVAADGTLRDGQQGSIAQTTRINYGTEYAVTLSFPPSTIAEGDQLQVALNRTRTFFSSASATGDAPVAAVVKHDVTADEAAAQEVAVVLSTNTRAMIDQVNGIDHPVRGFFGVHILRGQSFVTLAVADALMLSLESGPDAISPSLPVVDYPTRQEAEALAERSESAAERAKEAAAGIVPPLQLSSPPTTSTAGSVGQLAVWHDATTNKDHLYHLVFISTSDSATLYHWEECVLVQNNGKIANELLPLAAAGGINDTTAGVVHTPYPAIPSLRQYAGYAIINGVLYIWASVNEEIDQRRDACFIKPSNLDYAVRSVLPNVTEIPAATSDYSLVDSSATTLNHSHTFVHTPSQAPTYRLPSVSDTTISHYIELTVDFTAVQTYSFLDANGDALVPLFTPSIAAGDVYTFKMEYSAIKAKWLIYPQKQGAVADDFVMRGEVGAANGVAGLDGNAKVPTVNLLVGSRSNLGIVKAVSNRGINIDANGGLELTGASSAQITSRSGAYPLMPSSVNTVVTAALTDSNKISLNDAQKATAQEVFGVGGPITEIPAATSEYTLSEGIFKHAPTNAPTYNLPSITDTIRSHVIVLAIDFSSVQTFSFVPPQDSGVTFQSYANPNQGDVWVFRCVWYGGKWRIAPMKIKNCVTRQLTSGALSITDAVGGNALALRMTAPRSVVVNQLAQPKADGSYWLKGIQYTYSNGLFSVSGTSTESGGRGANILNSYLALTAGHDYLVSCPVMPSGWYLAENGNINNYAHWTESSLVVHVGDSNILNTGNYNLAYGVNNGDIVSASGYIQVVDLTQYFNGDQTLIDSITSWDDLVAYDPRFAQYVGYNRGEVKGVVPAVSVNNGTAIASPNELFAVGNAADEFEAVSGVTTRKIVGIDLSTVETWYFDTTRQMLRGFILGACRETPYRVVMISNGKYTSSQTYTAGMLPDKCCELARDYDAINTMSLLIRNTDYTDKSTFVSSLAGTMLYYELATPTASTSTPTQLTLQAGDNTAMQTDGGRLAPIDITYESNEI